MADEQFSPEVKDFIIDYIDSVEQLEVLLFLRQNAHRSWSASEINTHLRSSSVSIATRLADLESKGLACLSDASRGDYIYNGANEALNAVVAEAAQAYLERRVRVIEAIFSKPVDRLRRFADAFRLRRDK